MDPRTRAASAHYWLADHVLTPLALVCLWLIRQRRRHPVAYWSVLVVYTAAVVAWLRAALSEDERVAARWRGLADEVGVAYGNPDPPEGDLNPGDRAYFALHEAADRVLAEIATIRRILDAHLDPRQGGPWGGCGWAEHLDHGLTPATVNTDSYWDEGFGGTDVTPADPSVFYLDASTTCPCGESLRRKLENEQVAEFLQAVSR